MSCEYVLLEWISQRISASSRQDLIVLRVAVGLGVAAVVVAHRASAPSVQVLDGRVVWRLWHGERVDVPDDLWVIRVVSHLVGVQPMRARDPGELDLS